LRQLQRSVTVMNEPANLPQEWVKMLKATDQPSTSLLTNRL
jgi:hypothetical protein